MAVAPSFGSGGSIIDEFEHIGFAECADLRRPLSPHCDVRPDFKRMVMNVADDIRVHELSKLRYLSGETQKGEDLSVLGHLQKLIEKGRFSHDNVEPLEELLKDIERCDLLTKHIEPYKEKYEEFAKRKRLQHARPSSFPAQLNKPSLRREKSRASTDPGEARSCVAQAHGEMCLHSGGNYPHAYITVPEEETTTGGSSETSLELHTLTEELESTTGQVGGTSSTECNTPLRNKRSCQSLSPLKVYEQQTSQKSMPTRSLGRGLPPNAQLMPESCKAEQQSCRMRLGSGSSIESTPTHKHWVIGSANSDPDNSEGLASEWRYAQSVSPRPPHLHHDHCGAVHDYDDACSACSDDWKNHHYVQSNPLHCSLPALIPPHTPASYERHGAAARYMSAQNLQGSFRSRTVEGPRVHANSYSWVVHRKTLLHGMNKLGKPLKERVDFRLPVGSRNGKNPKISLNVVPCQNRESRHVSVLGEMVIPRSCSRHKWLVSYCHCSVNVRVSVVDQKTHKELGSNSLEVDMVHSEFDGDHTTSINLNRVLDHQIFLYSDKVEKFLFHASVQLSEIQCREDKVEIDVKEFDVCGDDFVEISLPY